MNLVHFRREGSPILPGLNVTRASAALWLRLRVGNRVVRIVLRRNALPRISTSRIQERPHAPSVRIARPWTRLNAWLDRIADTWLGDTLFAIGLAGAITLVMTVLALAWVGLLNLIA